MTDILDDINVLKERDPSGALEIVGNQFEQTLFEAVVQNSQNDGREIKNLVVAGMGGSALAALILKAVVSPELKVPFDIIRDYDLPNYADANTLVIASSYSGNTEETLSVYEQAKARGAQIAILASGGRLMEIAEAESIAHVQLPGGTQPRMSTIAGLKGLVALLIVFGVVRESVLTDIENLSDWLREESSAWQPSVPVEHNYAKQIAYEAVGKTPVFYGSALTASIAYKWRISWNESAKNMAFWNEYPEFNHNEFMGWTSHPVEKPFAVFDIKSSFDHPRTTKRFEISDRLLSGQRPAAKTIELRGETVLAQLLWGAILADFASVYAGLLNNVDPTPVALIEKLKVELNS